MEYISNSLVELDFGANGVMFVAKDKSQAKTLYRSIVSCLKEMGYLFAIMNEREFSVLDLNGQRKPVKIFLESDEEVATGYFERKRWLKIDEIPDTW